LAEVSRRIWPVRRREAPPSEDLPDEPPPVTGEPELDQDPPPRFNLAVVRLAALGLALVLTLAITMMRLFVGGPPTVEELRAEAGVEAWTELPIGVKDDQPGTAFRDENGRWSGFDIDVAYMIAEDLGFRPDEVKFYRIESEDRVRMQATTQDGTTRVPVKLVIASYSITPDREAATGVTFSSPYLFTEQSVITRKGSDSVSAVEDLAGRTVCTLSASTSQTALDRAKAKVSRKNRISECFTEMRAGKVDAISTDAAILAGYKYKYPDEFDHWDLGLDVTEAWGVNVGENEALRDLVDLTLYRSLEDPADDRWEQAFQNNLQVETTANRGTPIAVAQQPDVPKPDVREQPWERSVP
jgi:glutamate transport system substrate-binding protein